MVQEYIQLLKPDNGDFVERNFSGLIPVQRNFSGFVEIIIFSKAFNFMMINMHSVFFIIFLFHLIRHMKE